jgi:hypothetical protein
MCNRVYCFAMYLGTQTISAVARRMLRVFSGHVACVFGCQDCIEAGGRLGPDNIRPNQTCADRALG